ncbi:FAD-dependent oxidoreductase [Phycicoccus sp. Root101]|uniref:FAD-dependent oxidoreductase n=1 Tax=Phycicoccus sp. Root101 TaxID=1736421 RepID=UPI00070241D9|nr:FAD-dependent oxidoreductase [Phycicoccus sp. Root101]KQU66567.1 FAD/NAD(P)-binding oxidoreductase [Phycicoccus sp. Root101]
MTRLVVIGNGMVGARFVEDVLSADTAGRYDVTVIGSEGCEPYNRVLLSEVVAGKHDFSALTLPTPDSPRLTVLRGTHAVRLDREDRHVETADGARVRYDRLVLATGSDARVPGLTGLRNREGLTSGVHALRTIDDAREIVAATLNARRAVVLGAGVLGMEAACGLARRGVAVTVVHPAAALMERQLDEDASRVVESAMTGLGIDQRVGRGAVEALVAHGRLTGLLLDDGEVVPAELLVLATGTVPSTALAADAGLAVDRGVVVGDDLSSPTDHRVAALGDCAQPPEGGSGLVAQGWEQSRRLAARLCSPALSATFASGSAKAVPDRDPTSNVSDVVRLKAHGLDVVTMGVCGSQRTDDPAQRTLHLSDPDLGRHVEVVVSGGLLVGATCVGAGPVAAELVTTYTRRTPVPSDPAHLLISALTPQPRGATGSVADLPDDATVCRCNGVSKAAIVSCVHDGAATVDQVAAGTRATTGCGGCVDDVCALLAAVSTPAPGEPTDSPTTSRPREDDVTKGKHMIHSAETAGS